MADGRCNPFAGLADLVEFEHGVGGLVAGFSGSLLDFDVRLAVNAAPVREGGVIQSLKEASSTVVEEKVSLCRICTAHCPIIVGIDAEGRPVSARGDKSNPSSEGFFCNKGKHFPEMHTNAHRFLSSQRRNDRGALEPIASAQAMDEVAEKLQAIIDRYGTEAVAVYTGTLFYQLPQTAGVATAWLNAMRVQKRFSSGTIDQPGKQTAAAAHGHWLAGSFPFDESDVWMLVGTNPLVSISGGIPHANPGRRLKRALERGMDLVVIDPRKTETARQATLHIQPKPSTDPAILAGIIRELFEQALIDQAFIDEFVEGVETLRQWVEPYTAERVAAIADIPSSQLGEAARLFAGSARAGRTIGSCTAGTGANMSGWSNITEYLVCCINTLCGRYRRAGDAVTNPGVLTVRRDYKAQPVPPYPIEGYGPPLRVRNFVPAICGLPTSALADEILLEGEGQIRALITIGGNPMMAWPDQEKTFAALNALELHVAFEPRRTATAELAHYVLAPRLPLETAGTTLSTENLTVVSPALGYTDQYAQYVPAVVEPPPGADVLEDWEYVYGIAQRMGLKLNVSAGVFPIVGATAPRTELDMNNKPSSEEIWDVLCNGSWVPLSQLRESPETLRFDDIACKVLAADADNSARLHVGNLDMLEELTQFGEGETYQRDGFRYTLISRRTANSFNSIGTDIDDLRARYGGNPIFMHPDDMAAEQVNHGDIVTIESPYGRVEAAVCAEKTLRPGLLAMTHAWGKNPGQKADVRADGANIGRLISVEEHYARYSGIPLMSGVPINVTSVAR